MPFEMMVERVFLPIWIILVPVSACCRPLVNATEKNSPTELSPRRITLGYFQVMAEPVSDWVQDIFELSPSHNARLVTKLSIPPSDSLPANQFCTVEYLISASLWAITSTTAACS